MSLISDALRKARADAARRGDAGRWLPPLPGPHGGARRSPLGLGLLLGAAIALAAAAAGAWLAWRFGPFDREHGAEVASAAPTQAHADPQRRPPAPATAAAAPPATERTEVATPPMTPVVAAAPPTVPADAAPGPRAAQGLHDEAAAPADPPAVVAPGERVYVLHADVGYAKLDLDFIVHKPSAPFGRINGQDIVPGSIVEGFRVEEIAADHVRLSDSRGPLVLRVR